MKGTINPNETVPIHPITAKTIANYGIIIAITYFKLIYLLIKIQSKLS